MKTKQEEIREGVGGKLEEGFYLCPRAFKQQTDIVLRYLHSQGVVIAVEGELPNKSDARLYGGNNLNYEAGYSDGFNRCRREVKAGYKLTIPLIEANDD